MSPGKRAALSMVLDVLLVLMILAYPLTICWGFHCGYLWLACTLLAAPAVMGITALISIIYHERKEHFERKAGE